MLRTLFVEFIFPLLLFLFVRSLLRNFLQNSRRNVQPTEPQAARRTEPVPAGGELKKDPVCGTYVSTAVSVTRKVGGELVHFCSKECRDRFVA